jgi:ribosomal protein S8E
LRRALWQTQTSLASTGGSLRGSQRKKKKTEQEKKKTLTRSLHVEVEQERRIPVPETRLVGESRDYRLVTLVLGTECRAQLALPGDTELVLFLRGNAILLDFYLWDFCKREQEKMRHIPIHLVRSVYY